MSESAGATTERPPRRLAGFQVTKQHRRFVEFADAVRRHRYIGACYGAPGLGKTLSARTYAAADDYDHWFANRYHRDCVMPESLVDSRTLLYTPYLTITARQLNIEVGIHVHRLSIDIQRVLNPETAPDFDLPVDENCHTELVITDEADRLKTTGLEQLRDFFDRNDLGLILIGMPGFDRQLARYPQLYSRIGFAHHYQPLDPEDIPGVGCGQWWAVGSPMTRYRLRPVRWNSGCEELSRPAAELGRYPAAGRMSIIWWRLRSRPAAASTTARYLPGAAAPGGGCQRPSGPGAEPAAVSAAARSS